METLFQIIIVIISVILHEVSHGYAAVLLGDPTPKYANRLTLNPLPHLDPVGSVVVPLLLVLSGSGFLFAWARPVPYNPYNLRGKWGEAIVAFAGPASNILLALVFGLALRFFGASLGDAVSLVASIVFINLFLALFNLVPIPPLDGSKILFSVLPSRFLPIRFALERYGFFLVIFFAFLFAHQLVPFVFSMFRLITGISLG